MAAECPPDVATMAAMPSPTEPAERVAALVQVLRRSPEDQDAVAELCVLVGQLGRVPAELPRDLLVPRVARLLAAAPDFAPGRRAYLGLQGLEGLALGEDDLPRAWRGGVRWDDGVPCCPRTGLPIRVRRVRGAAPMGLVPGGRTILGRRRGDVNCAYAFHNDSTPRVAVELDPYYLDLEAVRAGPWSAYARDLGQAVPAVRAEAFVKVRWEQARAYAAWAGGRLPSQAEHETAMRGDAGALFPWGSEPLERAQLEDDAFTATLQSPFGLRQVVTDRIDWCEDRTHPTELTALADRNPLCMAPGSRERNSLEDEIDELRTQISMATRILDYDVSSARMDQAFAEERALEARIEEVRGRIARGQGVVSRYRALRGGHPARALHSHWERLSPSGHSLCSRGQVADRYYDIEASRHGFRVCLAAALPGEEFPPRGLGVAEVLDAGAP